MPRYSLITKNFLISANCSRHYSKIELSRLLNKNIFFKIDPEKRILHSKLHSSGHIISNLIEKLYPYVQAVKGHHFPNECYVEFINKQEPTSDSGLEINLEEINIKISETLKQNLPLETKIIKSQELLNYCPNLPYLIPKTDTIRVVKRGSFDFQPCGGTHVQTSLECQGLVLTKKKTKGNKIKISYDLVLN